MAEVCFYKRNQGQFWYHVYHYVPGVKDKSGSMYHYVPGIKDKSGSMYHYVPGIKDKSGSMYHYVPGPGIKVCKR